MAADSSFDVTSKIDRMELDNAINQAIREIDTRFDFKNTGSKIELEGEKILIEADTEERAKAALDDLVVFGKVRNLISVNHQLVKQGSVVRTLYFHDNHAALAYP